MMLDQLANRQFIVRRGRNNRILTKAIVKNIFDDTAEPDTNDKLTARNNRGQNHYLSKYEKLWSSSRATVKDDLYKLEPSRKRARKSSVFETCIEDLPTSFQQYALQRSLSCKRALGLRKLGEVPCSELISSAKLKITAPATKKRSAVQMGTSDDEVTRDEEEELTTL
jgi:hypothetical protein